MQAPTTCCDRCNMLTCGKPGYRALTTLWIVLVVLGIIFMSVSPSETECPSDCNEVPCTSFNGRIYDCTCPSQGVCTNKDTTVPPLGATGWSIFAVGLFALLIVSCCACCCYNPVVVVAQPTAVFVQSPNGQAMYGQQPPMYGQQPPMYGQQPQNGMQGTFVAGGVSSTNPNPDPNAHMYPQPPQYGQVYPQPAQPLEGHR